MDMHAIRQPAVTQQQACDAHNDTELLQLCIPGCDRVQATEPGRYAVGVAVKIGPASARFNGKITIGDMDPPGSYALSFDGQAGAASFGRGTAKATLEPNDAGCELGYTVHAQVGGKIAQLGRRLVDGAARNMAQDFFRRFDDEMQRRFPPLAAAQAPAPLPVTGSRAKPPVWVAGAAVLLLALWLAR